MPSQMVHLITARKYNPKEDVRFWIGSLAPDAVEPRENKDSCHFRNIADRESGLISLARSTDPGDLFNEGMLLHLFTDWRWDELQLERYKKQKGEDWFKPYREEIAIASSYIYHTTEWSGYVWDSMAEYPPAGYGFVKCATADELNAFLTRNRKWHIENTLGPSCFFTPGIIDDFVTNTIFEYKKWRSEYK